MNGLHHDADFTVILRQIQTAVKMSLRKYFHLLGYFYNGNQQFLFCKGQCGDNLAGNGQEAENENHHGSDHYQIQSILLLSHTCLDIIDTIICGCSDLLYGRFIFLTKYIRNSCLCISGTDLIHGFFFQRNQTVGHFSNMV